MRESHLSKFLGMFYRLRALKSLPGAWSTVAVWGSTATLGAAAGSTAGRPLSREAEQSSSSGDVGAGATALCQMVSSMGPAELDVAISDLAADISRASPST